MTEFFVVGYIFLSASFCCPCRDSNSWFVEFIFSQNVRSRLVTPPPICVFVRRKFVVRGNSTCSFVQIHELIPLGHKRLCPSGRTTRVFEQGLSLRNESNEKLRWQCQSLLPSRNIFSPSYLQARKYSKGVVTMINHRNYSISKLYTSKGVSVQRHSLSF